MFMLTFTLAAALSGGDPCTGQPPLPDVDRCVNRVLQLVEASGADLKSFTGDIAYRKDEALLNRTEIRTGTVVYEQNKDGKRRLGIRFDTRVLGNRREQERKRLIFDDGWFIEIDEARQLTIKRQLVRSGDTMDPLRLGGPFPLPVGQSKSDVLRRFSVEPAPPPDHAMFRGLLEQPLEGLQLTPRAGTKEAKDWSRIDVWYDPATWLPLAVQATETNGDVRRIRLTKTTRNVPLTRLQQGNLVSDSPIDDWTIDVRPLPPLKKDDAAP
jgi:hypothetical protein